MDDLRQSIKVLIIESLNLEDITPADIDDDAPLFGTDGLGLDSVDALELGLALHRTVHAAPGYIVFCNQFGIPRKTAGCKDHTFCGRNGIIIGSRRRFYSRNLSVFYNQFVGLCA